jgi:nucleoside-diphosphate-sugar epimerase
MASTDEKSANRIYNVSEPATPTDREWVEMLEPIIGWKGDVIVVPDAELPSHRLRNSIDWSQSLVMDSSRIRSELGYRERVGQVEGLRRTVAWLEQHLSDIVVPADQYEEEDRVISRLRGSSG